MRMLFMFLYVNGQIKKPNEYLKSVKKKKKQSVTL